MGDFALGGVDAEPLTTVARVAWAKRDGENFQIGVELVGLNAEERERIEAYAHAPSPKPG